MLDYKTDDEKFTCVFSGRMDTDSSSKIENELFEKVQAAEVPVIFDLKEVEYVSSAFLRICMKVVREIGRDRFKIIDPMPPVKKVFKIAGFDKIINIE